MVSNNFLNQKEEDFLSNEELVKRVIWYKKRYGPYIEKRGLHNWKNLFRKPTLNEWVILILLIGYYLVAQLYERDISVCTETLSNLEADACAICGGQIQQRSEPEYPKLNISNINFTTQGGEENG